MKKMTLREIFNISDILIRIKKDIGRQDNGLNLKMKEMVFDSSTYKIDLSILIDSKTIWVNTANWLPRRLI